MRISLTGGIACGKSTFAKFLTELGIRVLDADDVVHELEASRGAAVMKIIEKFGSEYGSFEQGIDRKKLATLVFGNPQARVELEKILFPLVRERLTRFSLQDELSIVVIPLLFESHWETDYDIIIAITSGREVQIRRMLEKRGYTREQAEERLAAQMPVAEKASRADYVVVNDSTEDKLKDQAERLVAWLKERAKNEY